MIDAATELVGADPSWPWPGVRRDVTAAEAGVGSMSQGRRVARLAGEPRRWPEATGDRDVVFAPLGFLTNASKVSSAVAAAVAHAREGGLVVTEELALPAAWSPVVEPVIVDLDRAVLASIDVTGGGFDVALSEFGDGWQRTTTQRVTPIESEVIDAEFGRLGFVLVGRWANWSGASAEGAPWHVAVHRAETGADSHFA